MHSSSCTVFVSLLLLLCMAASCAVALHHCKPDHFESDFEITVLANSTLSKGFGRMYSDYRARKLTVMNVTMIGKNSTETVLYISDFSANRTYTMNASTGKCSAKLGLDSCSLHLSYVKSATLGAGREVLRVKIFTGTSDQDKITMVATKKLCIPVHAIVQSDSSVSIMNFFNARIGIKNPRLLRIPDACKAL